MEMRRIVAGVVVLVLTCQVATQGELLVYYDYDEGSGTILNDVSGNGHTAVFTALGYTPPVIWDTNEKPNLQRTNNSSARITDNVNTLHTPDPDDCDGLLSFSVMAWVLNKPYNDSGYPILVWKNDRPGGDHAGFTVDWSNTGGEGRQLWLTVGGEGVSSLHSVSSAEVTSGELVPGWHHWAATYDGSTTEPNNVRFYFDGNLISGGTLAQGRALANDLDMFIACRGDVADRSQRQLMDEFRFYGSAEDGSGALSKSAIQGIMVRSPQNCQEMREAGFSYKSDFSADCRVDAVDIGYLANEWLDNPMSDALLQYYGFFSATESEIPFYQLAHTNVHIVSVTRDYTPSEQAQRIVALGEGGINTIASWTSVFYQLPEAEWAGEIDYLITVLEEFDALQYIVLNYVLDEPTMPSSVTNPMVALIGNAMPDIPTFINWGSDFDSHTWVTGTEADVVGFDYYLWPNEGGMSDQDYFDSLIPPRIAAMKSQAPGKPIILIGQGGASYLHYPSTSQMQMYADAALADDDVQGLIYYVWNGDYDQNDRDMFVAVGASAGTVLCPLILDTDLNNDCLVNLKDFGEFGAQWLYCNDPADQNCQ